MSDAWQEWQEWYAAHDEWGDDAEREFAQCPHDRMTWRCDDCAAWRSNLGHNLWLVGGLDAARNTFCVWCSNTRGHAAPGWHPNTDGRGAP